MHWTYKSIGDPNDDLCQGDYLQPTDDLRQVLREVHPHFADGKYIGFMVLTQSCDLVRRGKSSECSSRYVSIAVVRTLREVLPHLLDSVCSPLSPGRYPEDKKGEAKRFLERLLNQNEQAAGLFYLHPCEEIHLGTHSVVFLRVAVALRTKEHYGVLLTARTGRLTEEFQAKLGWLTGNLFSRVATQDWHEQGGEGREEYQQMLQSLLDGSGEHEDEPLWVKSDAWTKAAVANPQLHTLPRAELVDLLRKNEPTPRKNECADRVIAVAKKLAEDLPQGQFLPEETLKKLRNRLINDAAFSRLFSGTRVLGSEP